MNNDHNKLWQKCLNIIKQNINAQSFTTWFEPIKPIKFEDNTMTILVPNKFFYEFLEDNYVPVLKKAIRQEIGENCNLEYQIRFNKNGNRVHKQSKQEHDTAQQENYNAQPIANPFVIPGIQKPQIDSQLNNKYLMDNFIEGECNRLARNAGIAVMKNPGKTSFNPLFIYGNVGLGKTHLAHAIGNGVKQNYPEKSVLYVSIEKFTNQIIQAIKANNVNDFVNFYQHLDVLIVDDIQFLENREKTQEIFFHIFNQLHQNQKQIVMTSDRPPKEMKGIKERLISRFKWGLNADLTEPDFETRIAILESKLDDDGHALPNDVVEFISYNINTSIRELEGVLVSVIAQSELNEKVADIGLAKKVIQRFVSGISKEITIENIQAIVADYFKIEVQLIRDKTRKQKIVTARQLSMYIAKKFTNRSYKDIGKSFGNRDHSTVIYSCNTIENQMEVDESFKKTVIELEKKVRMGLHG